MSIDNLSGRRLGQYQLQTLLGKGGMGVVYRAFQPSLNRTVAVKVLAESMASDPDFVKRFHREARTAAHLEHPHIVPIYDFDSADAISYVVMPYLTGGSLQEHLDTGARFSLGQIADMLAAVAAGLDHAHAHGVVHRDVKPANIMFDIHGNPMIVDFGIARLLHDQHNLLLEDDSSPGTPLYMAPEQWQGEAAVPNTDQYALGLVAYILLTGQHPSQAIDSAHWYAHLAHEPIPPHIVKPEIPKATSLVVMKALGNDPRTRFSTIREFATTLSASIQDSEDAVAADIAMLDDQPTYIRSVALEALLIQRAADVPKQPDVSLVGRDVLLEEIRTLLDDERRVLLQGLGGMGKTALAATYAARTVERSGQPVLWLRVGSSDPQDVFVALARPFDRHREIGQHIGEGQAIVMRDILASSDVPLLVLDDAWNGNALQAVLQAVPASMGVIVTARHRYPPPLHRLWVDRLERPAALHLLGKHAGADYHDVTAADALCVDLGDNPFALRVAGKTIAVDQLTPAVLHQRIQDAPHTLALPVGFGERGRTSIKELLDASLDALEAPARSVFISLGAFFGTHVIAELIEAYYADIDDRAIIDTPSDITEDLRTNPYPTLLRAPDIDNMLALLVRRGLLDRIPADDANAPHFRLHDLAYSYAKSLTTNKHRHRALDACLATMAHHNAPDPDHFAALRPVVSHLLAAQAFAITVERWEDVEQFANVLWDDSELLDYQGLHTEALIVLQRAARAAAQRGSRPDEGRHYSSLGSVFLSLGQCDKAIEHLQLSLNIARESGDQSGESRSLGNLGVAYFSLEQYTSAIEYFQQALIISRETENRRGEEILLGNLGNIYKTLGQHDRAIDHCQQALIIARELDDQPGEAICLDNLGHLWAAMGRQDVARSHYSKALHLSNAIGIVALTLDILAGIAGLDAEGEQPIAVAEQLGLVMNHPATRSETKQEVVKPILAQLSEVLSATDLEAALERGQTLDLEALTDNLLAN